MSVTVSLAMAMRKMTRANSLVRQLVACETIGSATVICSDKTGTLTKNQMTVVRVAEAGKLTDRGGSGWQELEHRVAREHEGKSLDWMIINAAVNSTAQLEPKEGRLVVVGSGTEGALLFWLQESKVSYATARDRNPILYQMHFSSERKSMTTVIRQGNSAVVLVKGASEVILDRTEFRVNENGDVVPWTEADRTVVRGQISQAASDAMRTLAFAHRTLSANEPTDLDSLHAHREALETGLVFDGFVAIRDPLRDDVVDAVRSCREAGIGVKMVTGDNIETARAIGRDIGLLASPGARVITSAEFGAMSDVQAREMLPNLAILARARPLDKFRLVKLLQDGNEVVAVTGDGTNDAPALKRADVGLAMGISGTEVAKEASKIVLLDDAFSTIVKAVHWGRALYENIQRFIQFQLTINVSALVIAFLAPFFGIRPPFTVLQLLWINVIMDSMSSIAMASEPPNPRVLNRPPINRTASILKPRMVANMIAQSVYQLAALLVIYFKGPEWGGFFEGHLAGEKVVVGMLPIDAPIDVNGTIAGRMLAQVGGCPAGAICVEMPSESVHYTLMFNALVMMTLFNELNRRKLTVEVNVMACITRNPTFIVILLFSIVIQVIVVQLGDLAIQTAPLDGPQWLVCIARGFGGMVWQLFINLTYKLTMDKKQAEAVIESKEEIKKLTRQLTRQVSTLGR
jgi:Ca2+-transporting ATPase